MSFVNDVNIYKKMVSQEIIQKPCTINETSAEFMVIPKCEHSEETLVIGEEIIVDENMDINQMSEEVICKQKDTSEYFEENINTTMSVEYAEDAISLSEENIPRQKWFSNDINKEEFLFSESEESETEIYNKVIIDDQDGDEETIATFVTAAGQQLALYAVEDSDEIFAVAVYDESGEPPTNFQFLMKSDVERLIGEGAVRTVKKPTQIKRQLLTTESPIFFPKSESIDDMSMYNENKIMSNENERIQEKEYVLEENPNLIKHSNLNLGTKRVSNIIYATDEKQPDVTYLMMDDCSVNMDNSEECQEDDKSDGELVEQSTVQYILFEGDQSDSELTFDEIHKTLQNLKANAAKKQMNKKIINRDQNNFGNLKEMEYETSMYQNSSMSNKMSNSLTKRKFNLLDSQQELLETLANSSADLMPSSTNLDISNGSIEYTSPESSRIQYKTKRSRKQQLISVNREDSEIIIQPASLITEEDNNVKKRVRRNRRVVAHSGYRQRNTNSKRMKKVKRKEVEIIEIDIDEEESILQSKRNVVEITIDDSKDKYSSDKENDIIMVGDSDDELQQSNSRAILLQCQHCLRNFRQQRALETHLRVCSKSPSNTIRFNEQKLKHANGTTGDTVKKQYACKICQQKFDVVVALARHVRSEHSQRKKRRFSKISVERPSIEIKEKKEHIEPKKQTIIKKIKRKRNQRPKCTWEVKKLSCSDCGRWFPSAALLRAHCLQHGTKKSEQQIRRCQICKKLIRSRLLFVQHLKKHRNLQKNIKSVPNIQKKLHTTRSVTSKITTLRKRGRSRKL